MIKKLERGEKQFDPHYYWNQKFRQVTPLQLTADNAPRDGVSKINAALQFNIENELAADLLKLSTNEDTPLRMILFGAFKLLLFRHTGQNSFCAVIASPNGPIPVCDIDLNGDTTVSSFLKQVAGSISEASSSYTPIPEEFAHFLNYQFIFSDADQQPGPNSATYFKAGSELALVISITDHYISLKIHYNDVLFTEAAISRLCGHYQQLLGAMVTSPGEKIGALPMLTAAEKDQFAEFNDTLTPYRSNKTLQAIFEEQATKTPQAIALEQGDHTLSYEELDQQANCLASYLIINGVKPGDNVGLIVKRSFDMIIGMYAILKAGGAYVPVDPEYPIDRQEYILSNSAVRLVITDDRYPINAIMPVLKFVVYKDIDLDIADAARPNLQTDAKQLAYTIYTSGSTGRPKGVMIAHHSAVNLVDWVNTQFNIGVNDRLLFITSMCFDLSVYDIFGILAVGGTVVIAAQNQVNDITQLQQLLVKHRITFWDSVPTTLDYLVRELESSNEKYVQNNLRTVFLSGDWIPVDLPDRTKRYFPTANVVSLGGATEGTIWSNFFPVIKTDPSWKSIPYGRPLTNNFFYILNDQLQQAPIGVAGELYIGGTGVAEGYANDPDKTTWSFIADPFNSAAGGRMYRTGDLGRMLPDMNMEFIGRKDNQVKINGFRVELGEIESMLNQCESVTSAVVLAKDDKQGKKQLHCYIVPNGVYEQEEIAGFIRGKLPSYMIPALWMPLNSLPLNRNGKIDRNALPDIVMAETAAKPLAVNLSDDEQTMLSLWQQVMKRELIGLNDNFFELGGHSLMAMQIISRLQKKTGKKLPLAIFFKHPTITSLLAAIEKDNVSASWKCLVPIKATGNKMPLYIVHGEGLHVLNFSELAKYVDNDQPLFGLQSEGLDGSDADISSMQAIAKQYISEILTHDAQGPFALAGYSFGGFVAVEMERQLSAMGLEVKMLAIFDTNAENAIYNKAWYVKLPVKIKQQVPKFAWIVRSAIKAPMVTMNYQYQYFQRQVHKLIEKLKHERKAKAKGMYARINELTEKHALAFSSYNMLPFNNFVYLFKARERLYYVNDLKYLGWRKYAKKGVKVCEVPGDHITMLQQPHVAQFGKILQEALNNS